MQLDSTYAVSLMFLVIGSAIVLYNSRFRRYMPFLKGDYDISLKKMGRPLPPHPNG
jgi:hypothetical protein